jgi:ABC-type Fe3+-hydroxamate transport system substrate-binding protein
MDEKTLFTRFEHKPPQRVVSLVPSLTESLFELDLGETVVGITDYCTQPDKSVSGLPRMGGPGNARLEDILRLEPDLVFAGREENPRVLVESIQEAGIPVWLVSPRTVRQAMDMLWQMARLFQSDKAFMHLIPLETSLEWAQAVGEDTQPWTYFCPIWTETGRDGASWWMSFNRETYSADLLRYFGGVNVFAGRERRYPIQADLGSTPPEEPGDRDVRYPRVTAAEMIAAQPQVILLPDEPYVFDDNQAAQLQDLLCETPAVQNGKMIRLDGSLITWYGTRLARALVELPGILEGIS